MNKKSTIIAFCAGMLLVFYNFGNAQLFDKTYLGNARYVGMSGAYAGMSDDEAAVFVNPAGLARLKYPGIALTGGDMYAGIDYGSLMRANLCGGMYVGKIGSFGFSSGIGLDYFSIDAGEDEVNGGNPSMFAALFVLSSAVKFSPSTSIGINAKVPWWGSDVGGDEYGTKQLYTSWDIGILLFEDRNLSIGGTLYDINQPYMYSKTTDADDRESGKIHYSAKVGASYSTLKKFLIINADVYYYNNYVDIMSGAEVSFKDLTKSEKLKNLTMRGGIYLQEISEGFDFSLGAGYLLNIGNNGLQIDYAFKYPLSNISGTAGIHFVTAAFRFGSAKKKVVTMDDYNVEKTPGETEEKTEEGMEEKKEEEKTEEGMEENTEEGTESPTEKPEEG